VVRIQIEGMLCIILRNEEIKTEVQYSCLYGASTVSRRFFIIPN
jgi:hypothetical protein